LIHPANHLQLALNDGGAQPCLLEALSAYAPASF
jgi:hypothetical protein